MDLAGKKVLVIGIGKTGRAAIRFLVSRRAKIWVADIRAPNELASAWDELRDLEGLFTRADYSPACLNQVGLVVPSPGVPPYDPILSEAQRRNIPIISEVELASGFLERPLIAITGTNGKTTTTTLVGDILRASGKKTFVGGNIGTPLIEYVMNRQTDDYVVAEISSFQLQWTKGFHPAIAVLLNVTEDHLDYHGTLAAYEAAKENIFSNQTAGDLAVLNADMSGTCALSGRLNSRQAYFSSRMSLPKGIYLKDNVMRHERSEGSPEEYPLQMVNLPGRHNLENVMAAVLVARECGCDPSDIIKAVSAFRGIPHRIEFAGEVGGVKFYDDSKGTNVGAVVRALESFSQPIILLLGGRDKDGDFRELAPLILAKVKELILFGEAKDKILSQIGDIVKTRKLPRLKDAIKEAHKRSSVGDVILLSPGCASFDEFSDYKERGRLFKDVIKTL